MDTPLPRKGVVTMAARTSAFCMILVLVLASNASAGPRGLGLGAGVFDGDFGIQARKDFWLGGDISQVSGQAAVYFQSKTTFRIDADYHFILNPDKVGRFYPLAGLDFAFNSNTAKLGVNAGVGLNFKLTEKTAAFGEAKYIFGSWDGWAFTGGIYF
jgi:hypothetical protein